MRPFHRILALSALLIAAAIAAPLPTRAQWAAGGRLLGSDMFSGDAPSIIADGNGGAYVTWSRYFTAPQGLFLQHLDERGFSTWGSNVTLNTISNQAAMASDGMGGVIVAWPHYTTELNIRAQRFNLAGTALWTSGGVVVCNAPGPQMAPIVLPDGAGGATISWIDDRVGFEANDLYVQRLNAAGVPQWTANGVAVCNAPQSQPVVTMLPLAAGEFMMVWQDNRTSTGDIYAQRIGATGNALWATNGVAVCSHWQGQLNPCAATDGAGGAIVAWTDQRVVGGSDIYAQRLLANGTTMWATDGVPVCSANGSQNYPSMLSDGAGGAMIAWNDGRSTYSIYAQRISGLGYPLWSPNGVFVSLSWHAAAISHMVDDGAGGFMISWPDARDTEFNVYGQRVSANGSLQWTPAGLPICTRLGEQMVTSIAPDGRGGLLLAWGEYDLGSHAHRIEMSRGEWGHPEPTITSVLDMPDDNGGFVEIEWMGSDRDVPSIGTITQYAILRALALPPAGSWQEVATAPATLAPTYSLKVATTADSTANNPAVHYFAVVARTSNPAVSYQSMPEDGYSVNNQAPTGIGNAPPLTTLALLPNSPNPFSESTVLHIGVPQAADVRIDVFDVAGRRVRSIRSAAMAAGWKTLTLAARDDDGVPLASGVYLLRVSTSTAVQTQKLVVTR